MATINWRTINIDALDPDSPANFDMGSLTPSVVPVATADVQTLAGQIRQLLRGGDSEGALRGALENAPYGADQQGKDVHTATVIEVLQSIRASEMSPILSRIYQSEGGPEVLDTLMKYLYVLLYFGARHMQRLPYKGMAQSHPAPSKSSLTPQPTGFSQVSSVSSRIGAGEGGGQAMSVLLSWHEKVR
ncbi:putative arp2 3 complex subunit protein [Neofusicoccum parvum UCRNP2]|uniref:Actin-related protein 2/3 complex subunit 5 n=1 Tax=Botryosphaeria parva (strain UCR-NP2) TaxID=1287680 RepID=R1EYN5_BOTPV|nr:putative arp2 3 complex subunit protein [Neofusicoccum parvum UCRNP2]